MRYIDFTNTTEVDLLSRQVRALEKEVGTRLLWRTTRKTTLTAEGQRVFSEAVGVRDVVDGLRFERYPSLGGIATDQQDHIRQYALH
jgi:DNA-binding transcriptional LysR family regulator